MADDPSGAGSPSNVMTRVASSPKTIASGDEIVAAIDVVLSRAQKPVLRMSKESELSSSDLALDSGVVELF